MTDPAVFLLMFGVFPVWVAVGFADWICHRRTFIAQTSGLKENLLHVLMCIQIGVGMTAVALFEINAAVLLLVFVVFVVHELTVYWDLDYSTMLRDVGPFEQMVHSFLELLPLVSLALLAVIAWPQAQALVGLGSEPAQWTLRLKPEPLPPEYLLAASVALVLFNAVPLLMETASCLAVRRTRRASAPPDKVEPRM